MQAVFVCGGRGTRLKPDHAGPKSLAPVGVTTLFDDLVTRIGPYHTSARPPIVIVDANDRETPDVVAARLPRAAIVRQRRPDGVANALLLARPLLDGPAIVALGDLFLDGTFAAIPAAPAVAFWREAPDTETVKNFGISVDDRGFIDAMVEKPCEPRGWRCGMGIYILTPAVIKCFRRAVVDPHTGERGITDGLRAACVAGVRFRAIPFSGYYNNVNSKADLIEAEHHVARPVR